MKKILIVGALSQEVNSIKEEIKKLKLRDFKISYFTTGIGNYNMILNLTRFLENHNFDFVLNIGVCGYKELSLTHSYQGEIKHFYNLFPLDLRERIQDRVTHIPPLTRGGQEGFQISRIYNLSNKKELLTPYVFDFGKIGSIACSENVVYDEDEIGEESFVDMESYGFEMVCENFGVPRIILKVPVDKIGEQTKNFDFEKADKLLKENIDYNKLFLEIEKYLKKSFSIGKKRLEKDYEKIGNISNYFNFTFSQKEIFKKLYFKFLSSKNEKFDDFFEKNKGDDKKEFLRRFGERPHP